MFLVISTFLVSRAAVATCNTNMQVPSDVHVAGINVTSVEGEAVAEVYLFPKPYIGIQYLGGIQFGAQLFLQGVVALADASSCSSGFDLRVGMGARGTLTVKLTAGGFYVRSFGPFGIMDLLKPLYDTPCAVKNTESASLATPPPSHESSRAIPLPSWARIGNIWEGAQMRTKSTGRNGIDCASVPEYVRVSAQLLDYDYGTASGVYNAYFIMALNSGKDYQQKMAAEGGYAQLVQDKYSFALYQTLEDCSGGSINTILRNGWGSLKTTSWNATFANSTADQLHLLTQVG